MLGTSEHGEIIAIGPREQDFEYTNELFSGSVTLYGSGADGNVSYCHWKGERINHNVFSKEADDFIAQELLKKVRQNPEVRFMYYDPNQAYRRGPEIVSRAMCLNDKDLMDRLNHKISFRKWAQAFCPVHHSELLPGAECGFQKLTERYGSHNAFVVQADFACGGEGTFFLTKETDNIVRNLISLKENYLVSPYIEKNVPVNIHGMIYEQDIVLFPPSIQIMEVRGCKLLYRGADFIAIKWANQKALAEFRTSALALCKALQKEGYRGVTGVDGILVGEGASVMEVNNRFQGSTFPLNLALHDAGFPSVQELNYEAFHRERPGVSLNDLSVPYSCYTYIADEDGNPAPGHIRPFSQDPDVVDIRTDGLTYRQPIAPSASLERVTFRTNIVSVTEEGAVRIHPNIPDMEAEWIRKIVDGGDLLYTKIALLNQGVRLPQKTREYLDLHGGVREGVYNAVDISLRGIVINSAIRVKFAALSPFSLEAESDGLALFCCGQRVARAEVKPADPLQDIRLSTRAVMRDVCLLATDRVRVQHAPNCYFVRHGVGCRFCEVKNHEFSFTKEDIFSGIDRYLEQFSK